MFSQLLDKVNYEVISALSNFQVKMESDLQQMQAKQRHTIDQQHVTYKHAAVHSLAGVDNEDHDEGQTLGTAEPVTREGPKVGRNDPCSCGSGKKYKQCHGKLA